MEEKNNITPAAEQEQMQEELNELLRTRREKLFELQREGRDPFEVMSYDVTHHSIRHKVFFREYPAKPNRSKVTPRIIRTETGVTVTTECSCKHITILEAIE